MSQNVGGTVRYSLCTLHKLLIACYHAMAGVVFSFVVPAIDVREDVCCIGGEDLGSFETGWDHWDVCCDSDRHRTQNELVDASDAARDR